MLARYLNLLFVLPFIAKMMLFSFETNAQSAPEAYFVASDSSICPGVSLNFFDQSSNGPDTYSWFFSGASPDTSTAANPSNIRFNFPGYFSVTLIVSNQYGSDTLTKANYIEVKGTFSISPDTNVYQGSSITLTAGGGTTYQWSPTGSTSNTITVTANEHTVYHCSTYDPVTSCTADQTVQIWIIYDWLFVANTFHPTLDYPTISVHGGTGKQILQDLYWSIYDRWGEKIFVSHDVNMDVNQSGWNGTYLGKQCNTGVYIYTLSVTFADGTKWTKNGDITLLR